MMHIHLSQHERNIPTRTLTTRPPERPQKMKIQAGRVNQRINQKKRKIRKIVQEAKKGEEEHKTVKAMPKMAPWMWTTTLRLQTTN